MERNPSIWRGLAGVVVIIAGVAVMWISLNTNSSVPGVVAAIGLCVSVPIILLGMLLVVLNTPES